MKIIVKASDDILKIWNDGKIEDAFYRMSTYVISAKIDDGILLHNCITGELIFLNKQETNYLASLPSHYCSWMNELIKKHFIVKENINDKKNSENLRIVLNLLTASNTINNYTILPTTNCNARCFYCYEAGCKHINMSDDTANKLVSFIESHHGDKPVHLDWFGGEPLVGINKIDLICKKLLDKNIKFISTMVSNAYLFNAEIIKRAKEVWKLNSIQITLDGPKDIYNKTKAYVNACDDPYERVLNNIKLFIENEIYVSIRLNLGMHNFDELSKLVDELCARFKEKKYLKIYSHILFDDCGFEPTHFSRHELDLLYVKQEILNKQISNYYDVMPIVELPKLKKHYCMSDDPSSVLVNPSGILGKCEHVIELNYVGDLETGINNKQELKNYAERITYNECDTCVLYPCCIKLKVCNENTCSQRFIQNKIDYIKLTMIDIYNRKLKDEEINDNQYEIYEKC